MNEITTIISDVQSSDYQLSVDAPVTDEPSQEEDVSDQSIELTVDLEATSAEVTVAEFNDSDLLLLERPFTWENFNWSEHPISDLSDMPDATFDWSAVWGMNNPQAVYEFSQEHNLSNWDAIVFDGLVTSINENYITAEQFQSEVKSLLDPTTWHGTDNDLGISVAVNPEIHDFIG